MTMEILDGRRDFSGGYKVDASRGQRVSRVSSEWFSRPAEERFLSLSELFASARGRAERSRTQTVESAAIRVEASRDNTDRLALMLPGSEAPIAPTHWSFGQLAALVGAPAAYLRQLPAPLAGINLQYGLTAHRAEQIKTLEVDDGRVELRAVTGPDYGRIYDHELVEAVQRITGDGVGDTRWKVPGVLDWSTGVYNPRVDVKAAEDLLIGAGWHPEPLRTPGQTFAPDIESASSVAAEIEAQSAESDGEPAMDESATDHQACDRRLRPRQSRPNNTTSPTRARRNDALKMGPDNKAYVIDLKANPPKLAGTVTVGKQPSGLSFNAAGNLALVANRADKSVSVLSVKGTDVKVIDTIDMGGIVSHAVFTPDGKHALAVKFNDHKVSLLDVDGDKITYSKLDLPTGQWPYNVAVAPSGKIALTADNGNAGSSDGSVDTVSVVDLEAHPPRIIDRVVVGDGPEGLAISPKGDVAAAVILAGSNNKNASLVSG